jgi:hypothetical protein
MKKEVGDLYFWGISLSILQNYFNFCCQFVLFDCDAFSNTKDNIEVIVPAPKAKIAIIASRGKILSNQLP